MSSLQSQLNGVAESLNKQFLGNTAALPQGNAIIETVDLQLYDRYTVYISAVAGALTSVEVWSSPDGIGTWVKETSEIGAMAQGDIKHLSLSDKSYKYVKVGVFHDNNVTVSGWLSVGGLS